MESRSRFITIALAIAAATGFALAVQSAWWSVGEVVIGPYGARHCFGGECRESGIAWIGGSDLWMRSTVASRAGGYITMFFLVVLGGAVAAKRIPRLAARGSIAAIVTAAATGGYFAFAFPGIQGAELGRGIFLFVIAILSGLAAAILVLRSERLA